MTGKLYGVGVGPGDPDLLTLKAARLIAGADVIAYHAKSSGRSNARRIAAGLFPEGVIEERLVYPVTTGTTDHPGGYAGAIAQFYEESAERLARHLTAGRDVVLLSEGDPLFYGSYMYMHDRLSPRFPAEIVPGVTSVSAATAAIASPLVRHTDVLTILPGTLPVPELARRLADTQGAIIMKLGRTFPGVLQALTEAGRLDDALYVERASMPEECWRPAREVDPASVPYFSVIVVTGDSANGVRPTSAPAARLTGAPAPSPRPASAGAQAAELLVVGLGPGPDAWLTPEAAEVLAGVDHIVGYAPYVDRVPQRAGLRRHASGNTVEVDRAAHALRLAAAGERVAVVSGGDAGVFGMAAAVFEAAEHPDLRHVPIRVVPGMTAVQAVAARAGAPLGGDFAVMSLSDRLKPWPVIEKRLRAVAEADLVLGIYNPASRSRTTQVAEARKVLLDHRPADTVVIVGRDIGRAEESLVITTLGDLDPASIDMKCLLVIGARGTRRTPSGRVWTSRSVPEVQAR
ncbi:precorrin-2 C(20)-methyltransferase [Actinocorallia libanotica]|uniref:Precorrin-2 C(20)-methyltransferase n=1 Tax=Actinocorallia libanotica TaxID=46162 RepID=A0ABN1Q6P9_9ACTN